jgi:hypothetical protein
VSPGPVNAIPGTGFKVLTGQWQKGSRGRAPTLTKMSVVAESQITPAAVDMNQELDNASGRRLGIRNKRYQHQVRWRQNDNMRLPVQRRTDSESSQISSLAHWVSPLERLETQKTHSHTKGNVAEGHGQESAGRTLADGWSSPGATRHRHIVEMTSRHLSARETQVPGCANA